jgi:NTP pyrophosphatase (non-canonical NTP hydrolase)
MTDILHDTATSLFRRGFYDWCTGNQLQISAQVLAVMEELAEVSRPMRRWINSGNPPSDGMIEEAADVWIACTDLLLTICGNPTEAAEAVRAKLARDETRGYLHKGGPLR